MALGSSAQAFVNPPLIIPAQPSAADGITLSGQAGVCDGFVAPLNVQVVRVGGQIDVTVEGIHFDDSILCFIPVFSYQLPIGTFPPGAYNVRMLIRQTLPPFAVVDTGATANFTVSTTTVPAMQPTAMLILIAAVILIGARSRRRRATALFLMPLFFLQPYDAIAQVTTVTQPKVLHLLLKRVGGAPTPSMLVEQYDFAAGSNPPLPELTIESPLGASYLLTRRATGNFAAGKSIGGSAQCKLWSAL
jgi:hypothetical protein